MAIFTVNNLLLISHNRWIDTQPLHKRLVVLLCLLPLMLGMAFCTVPLIAVSTKYLWTYWLVCRLIYLFFLD